MILKKCLESNLLSLFHFSSCLLEREREPLLRLIFSCCVWGSSVNASRFSEAGFPSRLAEGVKEFIHIISYFCSSSTFSAYIRTCFGFPLSRLLQYCIMRVDGMWVGRFGLCSAGWLAKKEKTQEGIADIRNIRNGTSSKKKKLCGGNGGHVPLRMDGQQRGKSNQKVPLPPSSNDYPLVLLTTTVYALLIHT